MYYYWVEKYTIKKYIQFHSPSKKNLDYKIDKIVSMSPFLSPHAIFIFFNVATNYLKENIINILKYKRLIQEKKKLKDQFKIKRL
jgi:hypothetical protein